MIGEYTIVENAQRVKEKNHFLNLTDVNILFKIKKYIDK